MEITPHSEKTMNRVRVPNRVKPQHPVICRSRVGGLNSYEAIVADYIQEHRDGAQDEREFFQNCESLEEVIDRAALCLTAEDKRHSHHYRRSRAALAKARDALRKCVDAIQACEQFHDLFELVETQILPIPDIGSLVVYDVATWVGSYLDLEPDRVYLHAGAAKGAAALGLKNRKTILPTELPSAFCRLRCCEIEDCLCIYKDDLSRLN